MKKEYTIKEMNCGGCAQKIKNALEQVNEIKKIDFDISSKKIFIDLKNDLDLERLQKNMPEGYTLK